MLRQATQPLQAGDIRPIELEDQRVAQTGPECHEARQPLDNLTVCPHREKPQGEGRWAWGTTLMLRHTSAIFGEENGFENRQL